MLFQHALKNNIPLNFVLADYNDTVLRLVTLPNLLLTWAANTNDHANLNLNVASNGDLELTEALIKRFSADMQANNITFTLLSGPWSPTLATLIPASSPDLGTLILAAETIYSPDSTTAFVEILVTLLKRVKMARALIGAKRVYFGVGGSVDGLKEACKRKDVFVGEVENAGVPGMDSGVGRALIEVQMY